MSEWRKIDRRYKFPKEPAEMEQVLVYTTCPLMPIKVSYWSKTDNSDYEDPDWWEFGWSRHNAWEPLFWMPLPSKPEKKNV